MWLMACMVDEDGEHTLEMTRVRDQ